MHTADMMPGIDSSMATMLEQSRRDGFHMTYSLRPEMSRLDTPTLFIWGDQDRLGSAELGREMASIMPNGRCEVVTNAGHLPWLDRTERCVTLTKDSSAQVDASDQHVFYSAPVRSREVRSYNGSWC